MVEKLWKFLKVMSEIILWGYDEDIHATPLFEKISFKCILNDSLTNLLWIEVDEEIVIAKINREADWIFKMAQMKLIERSHIEYHNFPLQILHLVDYLLSICEDKLILWS